MAPSSMMTQTTFVLDDRCSLKAKFAACFSSNSDCDTALTELISSTELIDTFQSLGYQIKGWTNAN